MGRTEAFGVAIGLSSAGRTVTAVGPTAQRPVVAIVRKVVAIDSNSESRISQNIIGDGSRGSGFKSRKRRAVFLAAWPANGVTNSLSADCARAVVRDHTVRDGRTRV